MQPTHTPAKGSDAQPVSRRVDGQPETDVDRRFFDLRESGYTGWIDQDGHPVTDDQAAARTARWAREWAAGGSQPLPAVVLTPATILRGASQYLRRRGWRQGDMFGRLTDDDVREGLDPTETPSPFPKACALGAIRMAVYGTAAITVDTAASCAFASAVGVLADHLVQAYGSDDPYDAVYSRSPVGLEELVAGWNDDGTRIGSHVIAALFGAAGEWDRAHRKADPADPVCCNVAMGHRTYPSPDGRVSADVYFCATCQQWAYAEDIDWCPTLADCFCGDQVECVCANDGAGWDPELGGAE